MIARMPVLMYHAFGGSRAGLMRRYACSEGDFERQASFLASKGYAAVSIGTACGVLDGQPRPPGPVVGITMDDGYMDNYEIAAPILKRYGFSATIFVVPRSVGRTNIWMGREEASPRHLMGWKEIGELCDAGFEIGSHSLSHADLTTLNETEVGREVEDSKKEIEDRIGRPVNSFAYPYGRYDERARAAVVRAGYTVACTTNSGFNGPKEDRHALRRIEVFGTDTLAHFRRKISFGMNEAPVGLALSYYAMRLRGRLEGAWSRLSKQECL